MVQVLVYPTQRALPFPGPFRLSTWSPKGNLPLISCHKNILIQGGRRTFQSSVNSSDPNPAARRLYNDLVENFPEVPNFHDVTSGAVDKVALVTMEESANHSVDSRGLIERRNERFLPASATANATEIEG